jgi:hypothetical protein
MAINRFIIVLKVFLGILGQNGLKGGFWSQITLRSDFLATIVARIWVKPNNVLSAFFSHFRCKKKKQKIKNKK